MASPNSLTLRTHAEHQCASALLWRETAYEPYQSPVPLGSGKGEPAALIRCNAQHQRSGATAIAANCCRSSHANSLALPQSQPRLQLGAAAVVAAFQPLP